MVSPGSAGLERKALFTNCPRLLAVECIKE